MPKVGINVTELKRLLDSFNTANKEFNDIQPNIIAENPRFLLLLRLNLGLSQTKFEKMLGISKNIHKYESGKIKKMQIKTAEKFLKKVEITNVSEREILKNFFISEAESKGWFKANSDTKKAYKARQKAALISITKRAGTHQENKILKLLSKLKLNFKQNYPLSNKSIVDFCILSTPIKIIECKDIVSENRREQIKKIKELAYQGYKIKFVNRKIITIALFESRLNLSKSEFDELKGPFDIICRNLKELKISLTRC